MTVAKKRLFGALAGALALHAAVILAAARMIRLARASPPAPDLIYVVMQSQSRNFRAGQLESSAHAALDTPIGAPRIPTAPLIHRTRPKRQLATALPDHVSPAVAMLATTPPNHMPVGSGIAAANPQTGVSDGDNVDAANQVTYAPEPLERVVPDYPSAARSRGIEGQVILRAIVDQDGHVEDSIEVVRTVPALDQAAIAALRRWLFRPGRDRYGRALRVRVEVPIVFVLR